MSLARNRVARNHWGMPERPRVLVADDHRPLCADLCADLEETGFAVCAQAWDAGAAVREALRTRPDVCLLDIGMPGDGLHAAWEISGRLPSAKVVMLTVSGDVGDMAAAVRAGAAGYLLKDLSAQELAGELRAVLAGARRFPDSAPSSVLAVPRATGRDAATRPGRAH